MFKAIPFDFWNTLYTDSPWALAKRTRARRKFLADFLSARGYSLSLEQRHRAWKYANGRFLKL